MTVFASTLRHPTQLILRVALVLAVDRRPPALACIPPHGLVVSMTSPGAAPLTVLTSISHCRPSRAAVYSR